jgi:hypothetical protein
MRSGKGNQGKKKNKKIVFFSLQGVRLASIRKYFAALVSFTSLVSIVVVSLQGARLS